jgi:hypothetical protein
MNNGGFDLLVIENQTTSASGIHATLCTSGLKWLFSSLVNPKNSPDATDLAKRSLKILLVVYSDEREGAK